jgi:hypothetical protein
MRSMPSEAERGFPSPGARAGKAAREAALPPEGRRQPKTAPGPDALKFAVSLPVTQPEDAVERAADRMTGADPTDRQRQESPLDRAPASAWDAVASPGRPLLDTERRSGLGDVSRVRVHTDAAAAASARALRADAYTVGDDIVVGDGYRPGAPAGQRLMAHELAHVAQQRTGHPVRIYRQGSSDPAPTYGNLPRDEPTQGVRRVRLKEIDGKWREILPNGERRTATGTYDFVVQDKEIYAVKPQTKVGGPARGHTEAAGGGRVRWAGTIRFSKKGELQSWTDASGHYRPASSLKQNVEDVGLEEGKFKPDPEAHEPPRKVQLPVQQPATKPTGSGPTKVRPGAPRTEELEQHYGQKAPTVETSKPAGPGTPPPAPAAPTASADPTAPKQGFVNQRGVTVEYDVTDPKSPQMKVRTIDISEFPPDKPGPVTRFFQDRPVLRQIATAGASAAAGLAAGKMLEAVQGHFEGAIEAAQSEFDDRFPLAQWLSDDLEERTETYQAIMQWLAESKAAPDREKEENLRFAFGFEESLEELQYRARDEAKAIDSIYEDLRKRADALQRIQLGLEESFIWIHTHAIGALPPVYYESMTIWQVRNVFFDLYTKLSGFAAGVYARKTNYTDFADSIGTRLGRMHTELDEPWAKFFREHRSLLR